MASFDGKCVAFGLVVEGIDVVKAMENVGSTSGKTSEPVIIADCGQLLLQIMPNMSMSQQMSKNESEQVKCLEDSLKRWKEEYDQLIEIADVKCVIDPNKFKDATDLKVELKDLEQMEDTMKQCFEATSELKKQMCLWERCTNFPLNFQILSHCPLTTFKTMLPVPKYRFFLLIFH